MKSATPSRPWHQDWFDQDYLRIYQHRDEGEAGGFIRALRRAGLLEPPRPGGWVLDLACGAGRHSRELAASGYQVLGLDLSRALLEAARAAPCVGVTAGNPCWVRGDLARLPLSPGADTVFSLFTSLGYLTDDEANAVVWRRLLELPRPGGRVVLDFLNPAAVRHGLVRFSERQAGDWQVVERRRIDEERGMVEKVLSFGPPGQAPRRVTERVKLYGPDWFLARAGACRLRAHWGDLAGGAWREDSPRSVLVLELPQ